MDMEDTKMAVDPPEGQCAMPTAHSASPEEPSPLYGYTEKNGRATLAARP